MSEQETIQSPWRRRVGSFGGGEPGSLIVVMCGIHGNEPAGYQAAERVIEKLHERNPGFHGEIVALAGNLAALSNKTRFIGRDLNRQWTPEKVAAMASAAGRRGLEWEDKEQYEVWKVLDSVLSRSRAPAIFLDLHTSSADGPPFATMGDTLRNRRFITKLSIPVILGLEEVIDGALLEYVNNLGHVTVGVEAGRHDRPSSVYVHEAILWLCLIAAGSVSEQDVPEADNYRLLLRRTTEGIPRIVEVRYRHAIHEGEGFKMKEGFTNFDSVQRGDIVATDRNGAVRARESGLVLLPLYQGQGEDGFFLGREISPFWLKLSVLLRRLRAHSLPHLLPGVSQHPDQSETLIVDPRAARFYPQDLFHLFGYRKRRWRSGRLFVTRRREDLRLDT